MFKSRYKNELVKLLFALKLLKELIDRLQNNINKNYIIIINKKMDKKRLKNHTPFNGSGWESGS
jgi:hypothetical protein